MSKGLSRRHKNLTGGLFRERQIYYRGGREFRFLTVSARLQKLLATATLLAVGTVGYLFGQVIFNESLIAARDQQIAELTEAYEQLAADLQMNQDRLMSATQEIEEKYNKIKELSTQRGLMRQGSSNSENRYVERRREFVVDDGAARLARDQLAGEVVSQERASYGAGDDKDLANRVRERAARTIARLERGIRQTGLRVDELMRPLTVGPAGGPLLSLSDAGDIASAKATPEWATGAEISSTRAADLERYFARWTGLVTLAQRMPLNRPTASGYISSGFGRRADPITRTPAFHAGIDIAAPLGSSVLATGPGVVTYVGRKGPYGRAIEIAHGLGFKTRYGHLREINVGLGQEVRARQRIGIVGSSGRSTGLHLHYEVLYREVPHDPANFIEAGNHVFQQQETDILIDANVLKPTVEFDQTAIAKP